MTENITTTLQHVADELITMSLALDGEMEQWSKASSRPNDLSDTECVGFISAESATSGLNLVIDVQAPAEHNEALLRTWAIQSTLDENQRERFDNIQLDFAVDYHEARQITEKGSAVSRDDIHQLLHDQRTKLDRIIVSHEAGFDETSQQPLGERYDIAVTDLYEQRETLDQVAVTLQIVLAILKKSVTAK